MANEDPPKQPSINRERREKTNRIAEISHRIADIGHQISAPIRDLGHQFIALVNEIHTNNKTTETREQENEDRSLLWVKRGTYATSLLSLCSLIISGVALFILNKQLDSMHVEQRAWINVQTSFGPITENKPFWITFNIKNIGKTPAKRIQAILNVQIVNKSDSPNLEPSRVVNFFVGMMNPDLSAPTNVPLFREKADLFHPALLTKAEVGDLEGGRAYLAFIAKINYLDVFGSDKMNNLEGY